MNGDFSMKVSVIIPSLNPDEKLMHVVDSLIAAGFNDIIIVNDGSDEKHMEPFKSAALHPECIVLTHEVNRGKGRGLKTAFEYCIANRPDIDGVVTVDGDNQHKAADILRCCERLVECRDKVILGVRNFSGDDVPFKSRFGNNMTSFVFKFACGLNISDTQTGLRAIPRQYLELFCKVKGERFEYETNMLLELKQSDIEFEEVPIETVYIEDNASTHFHPIRDSLKIYGVIFKFLLSSAASSVIDLACFTIISALLNGRVANGARILTSTVFARVISSLFNYTFNRKAVFKSESGVGGSITRYYTLCICQTAVSYGLVWLVTDIFLFGQLGLVVTKAVVDVLLFIVSFQIQRRWVFKNKK